MNTRTIQLGELCRTTSGGTPSRENPLYYGGDIPWVKSGELNDGTVNKTEERITKRGLKNSSAQIFPAGTLLVALYGATAGKLGVLGMDAATNQAICAIFPPDEINKDFLRFYLLSRRSQLIEQRTGGAQPNISQDVIRKLVIPLPTLSEQQRIASQLGQADRLRGTRRYAFGLSETFLPAAFLQLFGDLVHNEQDWRFRMLDEVADIASGIAKGQQYGDRQTIEVPYLRVANVQDGYLDLSEIKMIRALPEDVEHLRLQKDDIVMTEGGDFDKLGRGAIWPGGIKDCIHQNHIFRVRLDKSRLLPAFFAAFLRSTYAKNYFLRCSKQTTNLASINMTQLRATPVALPRLSRQQQFTKLVARHESLRAVQRESLRQADYLFHTLLHGAFSTDL